PTIVRNLTTLREAITDRSIVLFWKEPKIPHGLIKHYVVRYRHAQSTRVEVKQETGTATAIDNLTRGTEYNISVAAFTISEGPSATILARTLSQAPPPPQSQIGAIVGGTIGGLLFLVILVAIILFLVIRRKRSIDVNKDKDPVLLEYDNKERGRSKMSSIAAGKTGSYGNDPYMPEHDQRLWKDKKF
ncbi:unnamed protein product, partial [Owenia fusiformis]